MNVRKRLLRRQAQINRLSGIRWAWQWRDGWWSLQGPRGWSRGYMMTLPAADARELAAAVVPEPRELMAAGEIGQYHGVSFIQG